MEKQRFEVLDVLRGLAVVFMVLVHIQNVYADFNGPGTVVRVVFDFLGGPPAAPVFMMVMGFLFAQKNDINLKRCILRGLGLVALGYSLNFFRGVVPVFIGKKLLSIPPEHFPAMFTYEFLIFEVDILIFAGIAYICMAIVRRLSNNLLIWELLACLIAFFSPLIWGRGESIPVLNRILQPFWGNDPDLVTFPLLPWLFFPLQGLVFGRLYGLFQRKFINWAFFAGITAVIIGLIFLLRDFNRFFNDYGQMKAAGLFAITGFVILWSLAVGFLHKVWPFRFRLGLLVFLGRFVTVFYIFHWMIIGWLMLIVPTDSLSNSMVAVFAVLVTAAAGFATRFYLKRKIRFGCDCRF